LARFTEGELLALHGVGPEALAILKDALRAQDRALAEDPRGAHQALSDPGQEVSKVADYNPDHKAALDALLLDHPGVRPGKMFGYPAYYAGEKLAICLYEEGVGVKLPAPSAAALLEADPNVIPFQPLGRPKMREWVQINLDRSEDYHQYAAVFDESIRYLLEKQG
jgi:hypothetical protein